MNEQTTVTAETRETPEIPDLLAMVQEIYDERKARLLEVAEDETAYRLMLSPFQKASKSLGSQARVTFEISEDIELRIKARETLDILKQDLKEVAGISYRFMQQHKAADEIADSDIMADSVLEIANFSGRIDATIRKIEKSKDARLADQKAQSEAVAEASPRAQSSHQGVEALGVHEFHSVWPYPLRLPPLGQMVPDFPKAFERYKALPPEQLELAENGALQIPQGYTDEDGSDLSQLWQVDWSTETITSGLTDEDTQNGTLEWKIFCREWPDQPMPEQCFEYLQRLSAQLLGPSVSAPPPD